MREVAVAVKGAADVTAQSVYVGPTVVRGTDTVVDFRRLPLRFPVSETRNDRKPVINGLRA